MIPVKIITKKIAQKLGLTENKIQPSGSGMVMGGAMITVNEKTGEKVVLEIYKEHQNGKKELTFMHKDRAKHLKTQKQFNNYVKQFDKIKGIEK